MREMDLHKEIDLILAQELILGFEGKRYTDWALHLMQHGFEFDNLAILAGLDNEDWRLIEYYFNQFVNEFDYPSSRDEDFLIDQYALHIATKVIEGKFDKNEAISIMVKAEYKTSYKAKYSPFYDLNIALLDEDFILFHESKEKQEDAITVVFESFVAENRKS